MGEYNLKLHRYLLLIMYSKGYCHLVYLIRAISKLENGVPITISAVSLSYCYEKISICSPDTRCSIDETEIVLSYWLVSVNRFTSLYYCAVYLDS